MQRCRGAGGLVDQPGSNISEPGASLTLLKAQPKGLRETRPYHLSVGQKNAKQLGASHRGYLRKMLSAGRLLLASGSSESRSDVLGPPGRGKTSAVARLTGRGDCIIPSKKLIVRASCPCLSRGGQSEREMLGWLELPSSEPWDLGPGMKATSLDWVSSSGRSRSSRDGLRPREPGPSETRSLLSEALGSAGRVS